MSNAAALGAIEWAAETAFAEASTTFDGHRANHIGAIDISGLIHAKESAGALQQYMQGGSAPILMGQSGTIKTKLDLCGHGSTLAGSPTVEQHETFLGYVFGNVTASATASTTSSAGTASSLTTAASGTFAAGSLARVGAGGLSADARGNGQFAAVSTHVSTALALLTAIDAACASSDVVYPCFNLYPFETPPAAGINATVPGLRFRLLSANLVYSCHGCFPTGFTLSGLNSGERPQIEITWQVSRWSAVASVTFPSTLTSDQFPPAPIAAGSLFVNTVGTATRATKTYRDFKIDISAGMAALPGPGGISQYQSIVGCRRLPWTIKGSWVEDADAAQTATPVAQVLGTATTSKHALWTGSITDGSAIGIYMPNIRITNVPVMFNDGGINRMRVEFEAHTGPTTTTDLTASAIRMAFA